MCLSTLAIARFFGFALNGLRFASARASQAVLLSAVTRCSTAMDAWHASYRAPPRSMDAFLSRRETATGDRKHERIPPAPRGEGASAAQNAERRRGDAGRQAARAANYDIGEGAAETTSKTQKKKVAQGTWSSSVRRQLEKADARAAAALQSNEITTEAVERVLAGIGEWPTQARPNVSPDAKAVTGMCLGAVNVRGRARSNLTP